MLTRRGFLRGTSALVAVAALPAAALVAEATTYTNTQSVALSEDVLLRLIGELHAAALSRALRRTREEVFCRMLNASFGVQHRNHPFSGALCAA